MTTSEDLARELEDRMQPLLQNRYGDEGDGKHMIALTKREAETILAALQAQPAPQGDVVEALHAAKRLIDEALPKFNWGASALDANAIQLLNEVPVKVNAALASLPSAGASFQNRVGEWMEQCFTPEIIADKLERSDRFIEEALELVQACGYDAARAHALVDYVFGRPVGEPSQEVGGVMVTLAALCNPHGLDMQQAAEVELSRILRPEIIEKIRVKQASKPTGSALPVPSAEAGAEPVAWEGPCPICNHRTFAVVDDEYAPGRFQRCVHCKTVIDLEIYAAPPTEAASVAGDVVERLYGAFRWLFENGVKVDFERPPEINAIFNEAYDSRRVAQSWAPPPRASIQARRTPATTEAAIRADERHWKDAQRLLNGCLNWFQKADDGDDCEYLNGRGWDDAQALASSIMGLLAAIRSQSGGKK
jgi:hypothetical protein